MKADKPLLRLFVAVWPDVAVRAELAALRDRWQWPPDARPVADENLHCTLHFIGAFGRDRLAALGSALDAVEPASMHLRLAGSEVWKGGIAVLVLAAEPVLAALHARIGAVLTALDVPLDERPFAPHVTMARKAWHARAPEPLPALAWDAQGFALVASGGGGRPRYDVLETWSSG